MHAVLALQVAVGILTALHLHSDALDAGLVAVQQVGDGHLVSMLFGPTHVHTHQHLRPVLGLSAAGAAVNLHHAVHGVFLLAQHVHQLQLFGGLQRGGIVGVHLLLGHHLVLEEVEGQLQLVGSRAYVLISVYPALDAFHFLHLLLGAFRVVPEVRGLRAQLLLFQLHPLLVNLQIVLQLVGAVKYIFQLVLCNHVYSSYILSISRL